MATQAYVIVVDIPEEKCPRVKGREKLIENRRAKVYLSNNTSSNDALSSKTRYGITGGNNAVIVSEKTFPSQETEIRDYLQDRFGEDWSLELVKCHVS